MSIRAAARRTLEELADAVLRAAFWLLGSMPLLLGALAASDMRRDGRGVVVALLAGALVALWARLLVIVLLSPFLPPRPPPPAVLAGEGELEASSAGRPPCR